MANLFEKIKKFPLWLQILIVVGASLLYFFTSCKSFSTVNDTTVKCDSVYIHNLDYSSQKHINANNEK